MGRKGAEKGLERRWNGAEKGYFMADKKPASRLVEQGKKVRFRPDKKSRKCLSAPQVFIRTASRLSAQPAFICSNRIRAVSLFHARKYLSVPQAFYLLQPYPCCKPFPRPPRLSAPQSFSAPTAFVRAASGCL